MKPLIAAIFRLVALTTLAGGVSQLPVVILTFDSKLLSSGQGFLVIIPTIGVFFTLGLAYIFWIMAPMWAEKTVDAFPSSQEIRLPDADWQRIGTAVFGLYVITTGLARLVSKASLWLWFTRHETSPSMVDSVARSSQRSTIKGVAFEITWILFGVLLYYGKDKIRYFWNRSGPP
jgi:hypothetical protein